MNPRVQRLKDRLKVARYPICVEKAQLIVESLQRTEGELQIIRRTKATAHYLDSQGVPLRDARDFGLAGCIDVNLPVKSLVHAFGMFIVPRVPEIAMNGGLDPRSGKQLGPRTGEFEGFETFAASCQGSPG